MFFQNGTIRIVSGASTSYDNKGFPVQGQSGEGPDIACQWTDVSSNYLGKGESGAATTTKHYQILVEKKDDFQGGRIRLFGLKGESMGEYDIISREDLTFVGLVRFEV